MSSASAPSTQHLAVSDADDQWDWGVSGANAGSARNTNWAMGTGAQIPAGPANYQPRVQTDWDAVGGSRHDRDRELDRGGGVRDGTTRPRNVEVRLSCVPGGPGDPGDDQNHRKYGRGDSKRRRPKGPDRDGYDCESRAPRYPSKDRGPPAGDPEGGGGGSDDDPSDSDAGIDDKEQKRHDRIIDEKRRSELLVSSHRIRSARKNRSKSNMRCEVEKYARGTLVTIKEWIVQMETYFNINSLKPKSYVGFMLQKIAQPYFKKAVVYKDLRYLDFREKLIEEFGEPDMATARMQDLSRASQEAGEFIGDYMNRMRLLVMLTHPDISHKERERILISNF